MTTDSTSPALPLGPVRLRKPAVAANLSFLFAGLGQVYCGCLKRGIIHMCVIVAILVGAILALATQSVGPIPVIIAVGTAALLVTIYSAIDARQLALRTRSDYRLKDYNSVSVYVALSFLFLGVAAGFAVSLRENFIQVFLMAGESMSPTLEEGSRVFVRRDTYREADPQRNDLVAFRNPENRKQTWVQRVIGLPGDTVEIKAGLVYLNGERWKEIATVAPDQADLAPITVPEHHCFVLGDNRAIANDSRRIGPVPMIALVGKVIFVR